MAGKEKKPIRRVVSVAFWNDDKVLDTFSPEDKLFMLYLLTNPHSTQVGVYNINKKTMAYELGYSSEAITVLLDRFENTYGMIRYSQATHEIAIKNYLRHSILHGGTPTEDLMRKEMKLVNDRSLLDYAFKSVMNDEDLNEAAAKIINEFYAEYESGNESYHESCNESGNESGNESYHESCNESPTNRTTNGITNGTPSIINNQVSHINRRSTLLKGTKDNNISNVVVVNKDISNTPRTRARTRTRGEPNNDDNLENLPNAFGDTEPEHPDTDTLDVYAANNIVNMNGSNMPKLNSYREILGDALVRYGIDMANKYCKTGVPTYGYLETILKGFIARKITTVEQAEMAEKARQAEKARSSPRRNAAQESDDFWSRIPFTS